jgi:hypothetical protein
MMCVLDPGFHRNTFIKGIRLGHHLNFMNNTWLIELVASDQWVVSWYIIVHGCLLCPGVVRRMRAFRERVHPEAGE